MEYNNELIGELLKTPLSLLVVKDQDVIDQVNSLLPYSTGFEIECDYSPIFNVHDFTAIPDIISVSCDSTEQRFRIPSGLKGIICLYNICDQLRYNSLLNPLSGIHYHVDATYNHSEIGTLFISNVNSNWVLKELDSWGYTGTFNVRRISESREWVRVHKYHNTIEFRIGEMTFDFNLILKRMTHCNSIVRRVKEQIPDYPKPVYEPIDALSIIRYRKNLLVQDSAVRRKMAEINNKIASLDKQIAATYSPVDDLEQIKSMYRNRLHRITRPSK